MQQANRELNETTFKLQGCKREQKRAELTNTEVEAIDDSTPMYRSIGARCGEQFATRESRREISRARSRCVRQNVLALVQAGHQEVFELGERVARQDGDGSPGAFRA